ncbi:MAG: SIS domain-containing protein [Planctomycetota bacterium]|jgi:6-phospho-3-hexuloisomerase|nr:SIS domain-containing protein [Planctomycetota bacterium]
MSLPAEAAPGAAKRLSRNLDRELARLSTLFSRLDWSGAARLADLLAGVTGVFVAGAGRSGLLARCFAMRLMQLGKKVNVAGETVTPAIGGNDLLLLLTGSGDTAGQAVLAEKAVGAGAALAVITARPEGRIPGLADLVVAIPAAAGGRETEEPGVHPLGSLFEQAAFLFLETMAAELMERLGQTRESMLGRHANLE